MNPVEVISGISPIILGLPHAGTYVPEAISNELNTVGQELADTDWHIEKLYDGLLPSITTVRATFHRYVIDANRDPAGTSLYPGQNTTELVPTTDFDGRKIWNAVPSREDIENRRRVIHAPYHAALEAEMQRVHALHGVAVLYDCHSIRSHIPFLFEGVLPDFNVGTNNTATCAPEIETAVVDICKRHQAIRLLLMVALKVAGPRVTMAARKITGTPSKWNLHSPPILSTRKHLGIIAKPRLPSCALISMISLPRLKNWPHSFGANHEKPPPQYA